MKNIFDYIKQTQVKRQSHLRLAEPCVEIGGNSGQFRGLLAHFLNTTIPDGERTIHLCHACHNGKCSNVNHLYWGTELENINDRLEHSGKQRSAVSRRKETAKKSEKIYHQEKMNVFVCLLNKKVETEIKAGIFVYDKKNYIGWFQYDQDYLQMPDNIPVDPINLPLSIKNKAVVTEKNQGLFGSFRDALPDSWGREIMEPILKKKYGGISEATWLKYGNEAKNGNLVFRKDGEPEIVEELPTINEIINLSETANLMLNNQGIVKENLELLIKGSWIGGSRPKAWVVDENNQQLVAKFPTERDQFNYARVEHASLQLAKLVGVETCESKILTIGEDKEILLVKRFDREFDESTKKFTRTGFYSGLTMMGLDEYDRNQWSYISLAQKLRKLPMIDFRQQLEELYRRMVFNIACRNTDDHPRNHGFLVGKRNSLQLSPAYDIVPNMAQPGVSTEFYQAMTVGEQGRIGNLENALSKANHFGLTNERAREICAEVGEVVIKWRDVFSQHGVNEHDMRLFEASFAEGERMAGLNQIKQKPKL